MVAEFNYDITSEMLRRARAHMVERGAVEAEVVHVRGAFDIPVIAKALLARPDVDGVVAIGAVVKGETDHDVVVAETAARGLMDLMVATGKPIGLAILGPRITKAQAIARVEAAPRAVDAVLGACRQLGRK